MRFIAGVYDDQAILIGKHRIMAIGLKDGKPIWPRPITLDESQGEMPSVWASPKRLSRQPTQGTPGLIRIGQQRIDRERPDRRFAPLLILVQPPVPAVGRDTGLGGKARPRDHTNGADLAQTR